MIPSIVIPGNGPFPDCDHLLRLLKDNRGLMLQYTDLDPAYIEKIIDGLDGFFVMHLYWEKAIHIYPSISTKKILERKEELYLCAKAFREDATQLMQLMADTFAVDVKTQEGLHEVKHKKSDKQRGVLTGCWSYHLHGAECRFEHAQTGQVVEVIVATAPEFGCLDAYFFCNYMATTERFKHLADWLDNDYTRVGKAIEVLARKGVLTRRADLGMRKNIFAA